MKTLVDLFNLGMIRDYPDIIPDVDHKIDAVLNLGPGNKHIEGAVELEYPHWDAETMPIPFPDNSINQIHCYHFLEHIQNASFVISEIERVLVPRGHVNIVVPYYSSNMQAHDLDHKHSFTETTFKNLFTTQYYKKDKIIPMEIATNFIMGDCEANLCLIIQLLKL